MLALLGSIFGVSIISEYGWLDALLWIVLTLITALIQTRYDESVSSKQRAVPSTTVSNDTIQSEATKPRKVQLPSWAVIKKYHFFLMPAALIILILTLYNNFLFLDFIGMYRVQAYPECTLYPYVLVSKQNPCALYPCEVQKYYDEGNAKYRLTKIYFPDGTMNVNDKRIYLTPNGLHKYSLIGNNMRVFLINRKYVAAKNIKNSDIAWEVILLILAFLDLLYLLYCFFTLIRNNMKLNACDLYFKKACENISNPVTHEPITDTYSYINALESQKKN